MSYDSEPKRRFTYGDTMNTYLFVITNRNNQVLRQQMIRADNRKDAWKLLFMGFPPDILETMKTIELNQVVMGG